MTYAKLEILYRCDWPGERKPLWSLLVGLLWGLVTWLAVVMGVGLVTSARNVSKESVLLGLVVAVFVARSRGNLEHFYVELDVSASDGTPGAAAGRIATRRSPPLEAELEQLAVDARGAPVDVLGCHLPDEGAYLGILARPPSPAPTLPSPVPGKAHAVPADHRRGLHEHQRALPPRPEP